MKDNEYKCAKCGNIYEKAWSDVDCAEEALNKFGDELLGECEVVCDDCYIKMGFKKVIGKKEDI